MVAKRTLRNERRWLEDGELCVLDKAKAGPTLVTVSGLAGEGGEGDVIYYVTEVATKERYPASDRQLRRAERPK